MKIKFAMCQLSSLWNWYCCPFIVPFAQYTIMYNTAPSTLILPSIVVLFPYRFCYYYLYISTNFEILFGSRIRLLSVQFWCHLSISGTDLLRTFLQFTRPCPSNIIANICWANDNMIFGHSSFFFLSAV